MRDMIDFPEVQNLLRPAALSAYLAEYLPGYATDEPLGVYRVRGGHSNETFILWQGAQRWVLRRPPLGPYLPTAHDVSREFRVLSALATADFAAPHPLLMCDDPSVIGDRFYLMEYLDGEVLRDQPPAWADDPATRREIGFALVDALAALHMVDWRAAGLGDFGKPDGYLERQVKRWAGQLDGARTRDIPALDEVTQWLAAHLPVSPPATIVHGDFRLDNALYARGLPVRILGVLDWEMATLGDPLADVGYLLAWWREAGDPPSILTTGRLTEVEGFPTRQELADRYVERTGHAIPAEAVAFYRALAIWKMAILLEGSYKRFLTGVTDDPFFAELEHGVPELGEWALAVTQGQ